jgi:hypothetical protein
MEKILLFTGDYTMKNQIIIDQSTDHPSAGLAARKIWKELFKISNASMFDDLDSFLCDLRTFGIAIEQTDWDEKFIFYWHYNRSGLTNVYDYSDSEPWEWKIILEVL